MADKGKTPAQIRDARIAQLNKQVKGRLITASEYRQGIADAKAAFLRSKGNVTGARAAAAGAARAAEGAKALSTAARMKAPLATLGRAAKFATGVPKSPGQAAVQAAIIAGPWVFDKVKNLGEGVQAQAKGTKVPTSSVDKALGSANRRLTSQTKKPAAKPKAVVLGPNQFLDSNNKVQTVRRTPGAPGAMAAQKNTAKATAAKNVHTVKKGDSLWAIAQANNTTVSALLKANPAIAKRKAAGKTTIFSGSKVRIPGKK